MSAVCAALAFLFAYLALSPIRPVEARIDYTPAACEHRTHEISKETEA